MQATASWSSLLIECSAPFAMQFDRGVSGEPARYGNAYHQILGKSLQTWHKPRTDWIHKAAVEFQIQKAEDELSTNVPAGRNALLEWLGGKNPFKIVFNLKQAHIEKAVGLAPSKSARWIEPHDEDHIYHDVKPGEIPGTTDVDIIPSKGPILVEDHKTGEEDFSRPLDKAQLLTLAAAVMRIAGRDEAIVAVLHHRRWGLPKVYADKVKLSELKQYEGRLQGAMSKIGDGSLRPGSWCARCPARDICPAQDGRLLQSAGEVLTGLTAAGGALSSQGLVANDLAIVKAPPSAMTVEKKLGLLYSVVKKAEVMAGRAREEIKKAVLASGGNLAPITPDGEVLVIREYEKENVSKHSIIEAYGKLQGERALNKLRADGALTKSKVVQLYPEKERGR